ASKAFPELSSSRTSIPSPGLHPNFSFAVSFPEGEDGCKGTSATKLWEKHKLDILEAPHHLINSFQYQWDRICPHRRKP
ncbi:hypothetical protein EMPG_14797, partial [Blastomyces silverae]